AIARLSLRSSISGHFTARLTAIVPAAAPALLGSHSGAISPLASQRSCLRQLPRCSARTPEPFHRSPHSDRACGSSPAAPLPPPSREPPRPVTAPPLRPARP